MDRFLAARSPSGRQPGPARPLLVDTFEYKPEVAADGRAVALVPADERRCTLRDDLATIPVEGVEPCQVVVATRAADTNPLVARFRASAQSFLTPRHLMRGPGAGACSRWSTG
ncbi:hypothetical protein [Streptomyces sp. NPDC001508]|uniref:hypothetical protein n=1 Tax=Streptomyces sp. NPDC001508 TaxID=3154656 RepID=UPI0033228F42